MAVHAVTLEMYASEFEIVALDDLCLERGTQVSLSLSLRIQDRLEARQQMSLEFRAEVLMV